MDRGNRRSLVASTLLAIPIALMIGSQCGGAPPTIGKLPESRSSRPGGLLQNLVGDSRGAKTRQPSSTGVLGELVDALRPDSSHAKPHQAAQKRPSANWDGIPYHQPRSTKNHISHGPVRDPRAGNSAPIIRSRPRTIHAMPASSRQQSLTPLDSPPSILVDSEPRVLPAPVPTPPSVLEPVLPEATSTAQSTSPLSDSSSSRRQNRRQVGPLDVSEINAEPLETTESEQDAEPKIARRALPENTVDEPKPTTSEVKPETTEVAQANPEQEPEEKLKPLPEQEPEEELKPLPEPKLTAIETIAKQPVPSAEVVTRPSPVQPDAPASSTLSPPLPVPSTEDATSEQLPAAPVPMAGVPARKFAAIPSEPAAHRAGPPTSAFEPRQSVLPEPAAVAPPVNTASSPIGSGVASQVQIGAFRKPDLVQPIGNEPAYVARTPRAVSPHQPLPSQTRSYPADPYAVNSIAPANPIQSQPIASPATTNPSIPMHPIADHIAAAPAAPRYGERSSGTSSLQPAPANDARTLRPGETAVASELPGIRVVTHGPSSIMIRQTHQFEIRVENRGSIDADGVMVRASIPDWAEVRGQNASRGEIEPQKTGSEERLVWTIDHLPAGATEHMIVRLKAERSGTHGLDVDWTLVPKKSVAQVHVHQPELELAIEGPNEVVYGESQTYKVRVLNPGDGVAPNVVFTLSPNSATPQTQRIGDIPSGKEAQFEVELTAQDLGDLKIHGLASGDLELRAEASKTIRVAAAKLEAVLTGPEIKYQDTEALYHLQLQNSGVATSAQIVATLRMPAGAKYLGGLEGVTQRGSILTWQLDALTPGAVRDYQFRCQLSSPGDQMFMFDCKGTAAGIADVAITTRVESISDLVLTINDPPAPAPVGGEVVYEIIIRNRGSKEATDVRAIAQFSNGIEPRRVEGHSGELLTGQVLFDVIPRIGAGDEVRLKVIAEAERAGHHRFRSEVRSGDTVLVAEEATHYMSPRSERVSRRSGESQTR